MHDSVHLKTCKGWSIGQTDVISFWLANLGRDPCSVPPRAFTLTPLPDFCRVYKIDISLYKNFKLILNRRFYNAS